MRDFLPVTIPTARIILFSYNQRRAFSQGIYSLDDVASILLLGLKLEREKIVEPERSIIFLAHSLGGFIVKHTLLRAGTEPRYQFLRSGTHGIGFFATPHQGAGSQPLSSVVASISRLQRWEYKGASESISWSDGRQHQYQSRLADLEILSFYETRPTKQLGLIVHKQSATFGSGREQLIPLDTDHYHIFEFSFASDENYKRFASCLVNMVRNAPTVKNKRERVESSLEAEALTLRGIDSSYIYENLNGLSHQRKHLASTSFGSMRQNIDIPSPSITGLGITMAQRGLAATDDDQPSVHSSTQKDAPQAPQESETNANLRNQSDIGSSEAILPPLSTEPLANDDIKSAPGSPSVTPMGSDYSSFTDDGELQEEDFHADDIPDSILGIIPELARGSMTDYVRIRLLNWLQVLPMRGHGGGSKGGQAHHEPASFGSGLISTSRSSGQDSEKRAGKRRANDDENNDESGNRKRTQTTEPAGDEGSDRPFACPFVKHDPLEHWMCWRVSFRRIHDLKQHLRRRHYDPISCARCGEVFDTAKERDQHHRAEQPCKSIDLTGRWGGVGEDQKSWLQKNKPQTKSDEEYWFMIFGKLFYIHPPLSMPDDPCKPPSSCFIKSSRQHR
ncbi:hypothetical protein BDV96DRAFT_362602 [Lophiotrema nucula]|uniref:DUF676 domain-containing protein n=1 Tax=Lophiotrema nucula TaxID=690887 RepID=A0A6A5ZHT9_9PLEO|nr:hypothetical protein BDV96DRAFT_362602 [Lophiotrema nucula]